jgi:hypothetical protein
VFVENKNSMYVSSMEDSLRTIGGDDNNIFELETNIVYKITDGDFKNAEQIKISRADAQQTTRPSNNGNSSRFIGYGGEWGEEFDSSFFEDKRIKKPLEVETTIILPQNITKSKKQEVREKEVKKDEINIYTETLNRPQAEYGDKVYFHKFRFRRNGHPITGVYTWIMGYGYYPLGHTVKQAEENFWFKVDKAFVDDEFKLGIPGGNDFIPFKSEKIIEPGLFYFVEGVQIRTSLDYAVTYAKWQEIPKSEWLPFVELSNVSSHPIINMNHKYKDVDAQLITFNGKVFTGKIVPLGSEKNYEIFRGNLVGISDSNYYKLIKNREEESKIEIMFPIKSSELKVNLDSIMRVSEKISEQNDDLLLEEMVKKEEEENELILEIANEELAEPLQDMQKTREKLMPYNHNNVAIKIINFIDTTLGKINEIIKS